MQVHRFVRLLTPLLLTAILVACGNTGNTGETTQDTTNNTPSPSTDASGESEASPSSGNGVDAANREPVTLTWAYWGSPEEVATHEQVAQAFMEEHPNITIEHWQQPWNEYFTKMQTLWASGDASAIPDVLFLVQVPRYAADGVLENLDPYIERSNYNLDDYWPSLLESATFDGHVYGLPRDISSEVLYYNKAIFDEAGVEYPNENWTWDDWTAAGEQLTQAEGGRVSRYALGMEGGKYQLFVGQNGGSILDDMRNPSRCTLDEPPAMEAISFFAGMMNNNLAIPDANLNQAGGDAAVFQSGQAAMIVQNASRVPTFNEVGMEYDVAPVPIPEGGQRSGSAVGAAWTMSASSENKDAAWTFIEWLQSTDGGQRIYTETGEILPALQSTARSDAFLQADSPPENREAFIIEGENAKVGRIGLFQEWSELDSSIIGPALQRIWTGEATAEDVLPGLCDQVDTFLQERGYPKQ